MQPETVRSAISNIGPRQAHHSIRIQKTAPAKIGASGSLVRSRIDWMSNFNLTPSNLPHQPGQKDSARERLIVALDVASASEARILTNQLRGVCQWVKVGLELYIAAGNTIVEELVGQGYSVFLDLKLHDIPNTVAGAVLSASSAGASLLTVHASGGPAMLAAAVEAAANLPRPLHLLAVTVLTSMDRSQLAAVGIETDAAEQVLRLARMARDCGIDGFVCSAEEVAALRRELGQQSFLVTPGIRPAGSSAGDQKRIATPTAAIRAGASALVVGRPITQAVDPAKVAESILAEIASAIS
jgi:orotidine-5'-phosphate decarboxylase